MTYSQPLNDEFHTQAALDHAFHAAEIALRLDPNLPLAHAAVGGGLLYMEQQDAAVAEFERAATLNPNFSDWRFVTALVFAGDFVRAIEVAHAQMRRDPFYAPNTAQWLAAAYYFLQRYAEAIPYLSQCISRSPRSRTIRQLSAIAYAQLGQSEAARREAAEVLRIEPQFKISITGARQAKAFKNPEDAAHLIDGFRKAGLPD
jgi:adenylate cyclase